MLMKTAALLTLNERPPLAKPSTATTRRIATVVIRSFGASNYYQNSTTIAAICRSHMQQKDDVSLTHARGYLADLWPALPDCRHLFSTGPPFIVTRGTWRYPGSSCGVLSWGKVMNARSCPLVYRSSSCYRSMMPSFALFASLRDLTIESVGSMP